MDGYALPDATPADTRFQAYHECLRCTEPARSPVVSNYILVKLAARCNIACTYCYWFRDGDVYERPKRLTIEAEDAFVNRLAEHVARHQLKSFFILFHGGEPLLFGHQRFAALCAKLRALEARLGFKLKLAITTNAMLIDEAWCALFTSQNVSVTVSIDGPRHVHDKRRVRFDGGGTFDGVVKGIHQLRAVGVEPGFLSVCDPKADPDALMRFFVEELQTRSFDVLIPDATHDDAPPSIAPFYKGLFDSWYDIYLDRGVEVRLLRTLVLGLLGEPSHIESIGYGPNTTSTLLTDGSIEPLDVLRTAGNQFTRTRINVFEHGLQDIQSDTLWKEVLESSLTLPAVCQACRYAETCGGGHIGQRWSAKRRFANPSVHCADIKEILAHIWAKLCADVRLSMPASSARDLVYREWALA